VGTRTRKKRLLALFSMKRACRRMKLRLRRYEEMKCASTAHEGQERALLHVCEANASFRRSETSLVAKPRLHSLLVTLFASHDFIRFLS